MGGFYNSSLVVPGALRSNTTQPPLTHHSPSPTPVLTPPPCRQGPQSAAPLRPTVAAWYRCAAWGEPLNLAACGGYRPQVSQVSRAGVGRHVSTAPSPLLASP